MYNLLWDYLVDFIFFNVFNKLKRSKKLLV